MFKLAVILSVLIASAAVYAQFEEEGSGERPRPDEDVFEVDGSGDVTRPRPEETTTTEMPRWASTKCQCFLANGKKTHKLHDLVKGMAKETEMEYADTEEGCEEVKSRCSKHCANEGAGLFSEGYTAQLTGKKGKGKQLGSLLCYHADSEKQMTVEITSKLKYRCGARKVHDHDKHHHEERDHSKHEKKEKHNNSKYEKKEKHDHSKHERKEKHDHSKHEKREKPHHSKHEKKEEHDHSKHERKEEHEHSKHEKKEKHNHSKHEKKEKHDHSKHEKKEKQDHSKHEKKEKHDHSKHEKKEEEYRTAYTFASPLCCEEGARRKFSAVACPVVETDSGSGERPRPEEEILEVDGSGEEPVTVRPRPDDDFADVLEF